MTFEIDKRNALTKIDKSKKGNIDQPIKKLLDIINKKKDYYTSSSCSGRIILFSTVESGKKYDTKWLFVGHKKVNFNQIKPFLKPNKDQIWLRQESFILHVCCRTLKEAQKLLELCEKSGLKRAGVHSLKKMMVEIINTPYLNTIIGEKDKLLVDDNFLNAWLIEANENMDKNNKKIKELEKLFVSL